MIKKTLTRAELYDLVWSTPMRTLAPQFHMSDVGLAKLCRRHSIPLPERGYWAKKEHGKAVRQPKLPMVSDASLDEIRFFIPEHLEAAIPAEEHPDVAAWAEREARDEHQITVPGELRKPHPLTVATKRWFEQRRKTFTYPDTPAHIDHLHVVNVFRESEPRVLRLLEAFIRAVEKRGWSVETKTSDRDSTTTVKVLGEKVLFFVEERRDRKPHELTPREQKMVAENRAYNIPKYDYFGTGVLKLTIDEYGAKQTFTDKTDRALEVQLNDIVVALVRTAVLVVRPRRLKAEEEQRRWEEQRRRMEVQQRRQTQFGELLTHWAKHRERQAVLAEVEQTLAAAPDLAAHPDVRAWVEWARAHVAGTNPIRLYLSAIVSGKAQKSYIYPPIWTGE